MALSLSQTPKWLRTLLSIIFILTLIIIIFNATTYQVQYGTVAVITRFGEIVGEPKQPGLHVRIPFIDQVVTYKTQKIIYETVDQEIYNTNTYYVSTDGAYNNTGLKMQQSGYQDIAVDTTTIDGQQISVRFTVRFSIDPEKLKQIATTLGTEAEVVDKIVKTESRIWARNIPRSYTAYDLYTGNIDNVSQEIKEHLEPLFNENGLILDEFGIRSISFQPDYVNTIEQKQIEKEKITTEEYIAEQELYKKQALITKSEGEAEAQRLQQQTLTDQLIRKLWIEKWNGELPDTMAGQDSNILLGL
ncbi:MAG TPA: prohibitin family protein [Candidatus Dojkabacteria bacterium]|nr:prohibitin family protein [Candidatus Dojkabacteria bacterium]